MTQIKDHSERYRLSNELHARPFPSLSAPCRAVFLAVKQAEAAVARDRAADLAHLIDLLDRFGAPHPQPGATHWHGGLGKHHMKWESHTEFVTYTVFLDGLGERPFDAADFEVFPADWRAAMPGERVTSALIRVEPRPAEPEVLDRLDAWFVPESLASSRVLDDAAVVAGDFRIDSHGHMRFAVFPTEGTGQRRVGRVVQRLCEIETYKTMSMLGFARAKSLGKRLAEIDHALNSLVGSMSDAEKPAEETLRELLQVSAELEDISAQASFRFGATEAYEAIVLQRVQVMREERLAGRQTFHEFMMRRYDPAMRTVKSTQGRLAGMSDRAMRASDLLRTRVDVERSAQNQALLESMDKRADLQLRLQTTVEGLSVVAISYYAVSLGGYLAGPLAYPLGLDKVELMAAITLPVVLAVWWIIRRIRHAYH
ncbi:DUF3422 family protein [Mesobacterium pallidum]|uniref:DUF3422 family protein n=1 Tax=Mesobacterium pallidum TaxID=2872037 RepID=UPI001EE36121|nr:DUF3422 domain-containing protein [Mesobacterium pallidum]